MRERYYTFALFNTFTLLILVSTLSGKIKLRQVIISYPYNSVVPVEHYPCRLCFVITSDCAAKNLIKLLQLVYIHIAGMSFLQALI